ncbi:hypothetical protein CEXT_222801 [Caerostris extrusa]|uniref:Uncharacterized protein n=1 Tax=Caerostris extrusa TaxID=172846 RepID=A0AAV4NP51_CAEEX|nr:hypothetical protein CEXT_222801 [Caerostris extrusa]
MESFLALSLGLCGPKVVFLVHEMDVGWRVGENMPRSGRIWEVVGGKNDVVIFHRRSYMVFLLAPFQQRGYMGFLPVTRNPLLDEVLSGSLSGTLW